ncbi:MAG: hypothetical protein JXR63_13515 [Spirochaetales bacterium]|nr:hypothetical protein [Spirochaetales bacterium]
MSSLLDVFADENVVLDIYFQPLQAMFGRTDIYWDKNITEDFREIPDMLFQAEIHTFLKTYVNKPKMHKLNCVVPVPSHYNKDRLARTLATSGIFEKVYLVDCLKSVAFDCGLFDEKKDDSIFTKKIFVYISKKHVNVGVVFYKHVISPILEVKFDSFPEWEPIERLIDYVVEHCSNAKIVSDCGLSQDEFDALILNGLDKGLDKFVHVAVDPYNPGKIHNAPSQKLKYYFIESHSVLRGALQVVANITAINHKTAAHHQVRDNVQQSSNNDSVSKGSGL